MKGIKASVFEIHQVPKHKSRYKALNWLCLGIVLIPIISFIVFNGFPVLLSFISMFTSIDNNNISSMEWNGFQNFAEVFRDELFWKSWLNTLIIGSSQFVTLIVALIISVMLEQNVKGAKVLQVIYFIPYICSSVAVAIMWQWVFNTGNGVLNAILGKIELNSQTGELWYMEWLNSMEHPRRLVFAIYVTIMWQAPAYGIVMFKAALKNVNPSLYEAASLDGAGAFAKFRHVTMPALKSVFLFLLLCSITNGLAVFDSVKVLAPLSWTQEAGPENVALTINYYIYNKGVASMDMELAAVASWVLFIVSFVCSFPVILARNKAAEA